MPDHFPLTVEAAAARAYDAAWKRHSARHDPLKVPPRDWFLDGYEAAAREEARQEDGRSILAMERDWLLGAWAAACGIPQSQAEAEFLVATAKWREVAVEKEPAR